MKLGKIIIPALLALGAIGGFATAKAVENREAQRTVAMSGYTGDPDIDVGLNVNVSKGSGNWADSCFYINTFESANVSGGEYLAIRMRGNNGSGSYFDFFVNVDGVVARIPIDPAATGLKCVPAVPDGIAWDYNGNRTWDLPMNFQAPWDVYFCIPKSQFTRGGTVDWSKNVWAIYFTFYGTTPNDNIDFDIGNVYTANIDSNNHLQKVNRIINWANIDGLGMVQDYGLENSYLHPVRNNPTLKPAVKFIQAIEGVDACDNSAALAAYNANLAAYEALDDECLDYLEDAIVGDYDDGDKTHAGGKLIQWKAAAKWAQICKAANPSSSRLVLFHDDKNTALLITAIGLTVGALSVAGLFFFLRKRKLSK